MTRHKCANVSCNKPAEADGKIGEEYCGQHRNLAVIIFAEESNIKAMRFWAKALNDAFVNVKKAIDAIDWGK